MATTMLIHEVECNLGRSYKVDFKKMQLKEVDVLLKTVEPEKPTELREHQPEPEDWRTVLARLDESSEYRPQYENYLKDVLPDHLHEEQATDSRLEAMDTFHQSQGGGYELDPLMAEEEFLPPVPLSACLHPTGNRVQDRLGISFKTEAHQR